MQDFYYSHELIEHIQAYCRNRFGWELTVPQAIDFLNEFADMYEQFKRMVEEAPQEPPLGGHGDAS